MEHPYGLGKTAMFIISAIVGLIKFASHPLLFIDATFLAKLFEAGITAFVCGSLGVAGKMSIDWVKRKYINKNKKS